MTCSKEAGKALDTLELLEHRLIVFTSEHSPQYENAQHHEEFLISKTAATSVHVVSVDLPLSEVYTSTSLRSVLH